MESVVSTQVAGMAAVGNRATWGCAEVPAAVRAGATPERGVAISGRDWCVCRCACASPFPSPWAPSVATVPGPKGGRWALAARGSKSRSGARISWRRRRTTSTEFGLIQAVQAGAAVVAAAGITSLAGHGPLALFGRQPVRGLGEPRGRCGGSLIRQSRGENSEGRALEHVGHSAPRDGRWTAVLQRAEDDDALRFGLAGSLECPEETSRKRK